MDMVFDATQFQPQQGAGAHPVGTFDAQITNTYAKGTKDNTGGMFVAEFTSPQGKIETRYNLWNSSTQAVEIAQKSLSALCHAVGIFKITFPKLPDGSPDMQNAGRELRGARCKIEVAYQIDRETKQPTAYVEVKRVLDLQGNEPGRAPQAAPQPQQATQGQQAPMTQQSNGGWGAPNPAPQSTQGGWGNNQNPTQAAPQQNNNPGWQQNNPNPNPSPPWGQR